jgi:arylsulfatase
MSPAALERTRLLLPPSKTSARGLAAALAGAAILFSLAGCGGKEPTPTAAESVETASGTPKVRGVVLISVDTLRADRLGLYGNKRMLSPNLDGLGHRSVVFEAAHSQASQTAPSHASVFTSQRSSVHGIYNVHGDDTSMPVLPEGVRTLAEEVSAAGVTTAAFVSSGNLTRGMGMARGFGVWDEKNEDVRGRVDAFLKWLPEVGDKPFLALLHTYQAHAPYVPPREQAERLTDPAYQGALRSTYESFLAMPAEEAWRRGVGPDYWGPDMVSYSEADVRFLSDLYDGEIAYVDAELRRVLEAVLTGPRRDDTAIVFFSDHGEEFRDHGKFQHDQIHEELIHVPLVVFGGAALERASWKGRIPGPVRLIDVAPTVADLLGVQWNPGLWAGRSLVPLMDPATRAAASREEERPAFAEFTRDHRNQVYRALSWHGWKYIEHRQIDIGKTWESLFDLATDPHEQHDLLTSTTSPAPENLASLRQLLGQLEKGDADMARRVGGAGSATLSSDAQEGLNSLGYTGTKKGN